MAEKLIVIGGTAAGLSAAAKAKRLQPDMEITVFERSGYVSYGACGLPYFVGDIIKEADELISLTPQVLSEKRGIPTYTHHEVTHIDRTAKTVEVTNLTTGESATHAYDKLVIATGATPVRPNLPGINANGVYCLRTVEDGLALKAAAHSTAKSVAIIGGGFIGLELAEELTQSGLQVHLYEVAPRLLPFLDAGFSATVEAELAAHGVQVHTGAAVTAIVTENGTACGIADASGTEQAVDFVVLSVGVSPCSALARECGLAIGYKGGIVVDETQQTSDKSIWAAGDCVAMKHRVTGDATYVPLGTTANKQGRIAGGNLAGEADTFPGVLGSMVTKVFSLYIAATGLSLAQAEEAGYATAYTVITKSDRASYYPGGQDNQICLIQDKTTGRLLGAQAIGSETVAGRINVMVAAITAGMTVQDINNLDLVYAPPVAPVYDPILIAASQAMKKTDRT